jgi:hypothetical protein
MATMKTKQAYESDKGGKVKNPNGAARGCGHKARLNTIE